MKKYFLSITLLFLIAQNLDAANGDTTHVMVFNTVSWNHYGNFDQWGVFPPATKKFQRILMKYTVGCESGGQCEWDYTNTIYVRQNTHIKDSTLKKATTFTVNGSVKDSFSYSTDTTWSTSYNSTTKKTDSVPSTRLTIIRFLFVSQQQPQVVIDTIKVFPVQYYKYYYDTTGKKIDSIFVAVKQTIYAVYTNYYSVFDKIIDYEMGRMITPYAKSGTLPRPFNYQYWYDVTDYASMLYDSAQIRFNYSGYSWGFTGTIEFFMIEGTPAREAYKVENTWNGYFAYGNKNDSIEHHLTPYNFIKDATTSSVKLRMTITGHGSDTFGCCEFYPSQYYVKLNGNQIAQNYVWKDDCGSNPIINQGGTWIYNRANWCPGMIVNPYQYNLSSVNSGSNTIAVNMDPYSNFGKGSGGYAFGTQLIYYKNNSYNVDGGIETILAPTKDFIYNRTNPICDNAKIIIRNFGIQNITSAIIKYQVGNGTVQTFNWAGNLKFDEKDTFTLPNMIWSNPSGALTFTVWLDKVNNQADENPFNNSLTSSIDMPMTLPMLFVIESRTNNYPGDNSYIISNSSGQILFYKTYPAANTLYRDTFQLGFGNYSFNFIDSSGDGLSFWNNPAQGSGSVRFLKAPLTLPQPILKSFNPDFGNFLNFNFSVGAQVAVEEKENISSLITLYPQPASDKIFFRSEKIYLTNGKLFSLEGKIIKTFSAEEISSGELNTSGISNGIYFLQLNGTVGEQVVKKVVVVK
ncbi:MAG: peptide-N-glycosidase F-related protein [Bacteroidia bacterium]